MKIHKAVIPIAGKGTRLLPLTGVLPKALFPLVERNKGIRAVLHVLLERLYEAGIEDIAVIISPGQEKMVRDYVKIARANDGLSLPSDIHFIEQEQALGFGDAVFQTREFVGSDPFVLLLGDHIQEPGKGAKPCLLQVIEAFERIECKAMIGVHDVEESVLDTVGIAAGVTVEDRIYRCVDFMEKPGIANARKRLKTVGISNDRYLGHCGIYVLGAEIFDCLALERERSLKEGAEIELAAAQEMLLRQYPEEYYLYWIEGRAYDMGHVQAYLETLMAIGGTRDVAE